jgi:pimeloyl-ACP methyl ester carboxylesterase
MNRVLYLHGFASGPGSAKARVVGRRLESAGMRVDIPDLANGNFERLTITSQLAIVERCARGEPVPLVGSSLGGYLAALYAARHPEVPRVVLLAPAFRFGRLWAERLGEGEMDAWRRSGTLEVYHFQERRNLPLGYDLMDDAARYEDFPDFRQPALIVHGTRDDVVPPSSSELFAGTHRNARLWLVDSTHELVDVIEPVAERIAAFVLGK